MSKNNNQPQENEYRIIWQYMPPPLAGQIEGIAASPEDFLDEEELNEYGLDVAGMGKFKDFMDKLADHQDREYAKGVMTQYGVLPINETYNPFDFWIGHCNFEINETVLNIIASVPGVEVCNVHTRYRFRISIGKVFDTKAVMREVKRQVMQCLNSLQIVYNTGEDLGIKVLAPTNWQEQQEEA